MSGEEIFMKKENRDARWRELKSQGYKVTRERWRNVQYHPKYVRDWPDKEAVADTDLGNLWYKTRFKMLYTLYYEESIQNTLL